MGDLVGKMIALSESPGTREVQLLYRLDALDLYGDAN